MSTVHIMWWKKGKKNNERIWNNLFSAWRNNCIAIFNLSENVKGEAMRLIDVDALLAQMKEYRERQAEEANMTGDRAVCVTWHDAVILIKNALTVDAVPVKRGEWLWLDGVRCSKCNYKLETTGLPAYCPSCGARMDEE